MKNECGTAAKVCDNIGAFGVGINELDKIGGSVYPNITSNEITVRLQGASTVQIVNMIGAVVSTRNITDKATFDVSALPAGVYFVNIQKGSENMVKKFIVQ